MDDGGGSFSVLVVDDSPTVVEELRRMVEDIEGARVVGTEDTVEGSLEALERRAPDLLLLDLDLPDGSGLEVLDRLGTAGRRVAAYVVTGHGSPRIRRVCLERGATEFFDKATQIGELEGALRTAVEDARER